MASSDAAVAAAAAAAMPTAMVCRLEDLPSELLLMVLGELPPAAVGPLLAASPRCLRVFQARRASALEAVVRRSICPENLSLALAACGAPRVPSSAKPAPPPAPDSLSGGGGGPDEFFDVAEELADCLDYDDDEASDCSTETVTQLDFLSAQSQPSVSSAAASSSAVSDVSDASDVSELSELPPDRTEAGIGLALLAYQDAWEAQALEAGNVELWTRLFKLAHVLESFVADYARDALGKLSGVLTPGGSAAADEHEPHLTPTERSRLQRAFLRFEIYRKVCLTGLLLHDWSPLKMRPACWRWFVRPLAPWELEQLSAVYAYLWSRVEATAFELEDDLVQRLNARRQRHERDAPPVPPGDDAAGTGASAADATTLFADAGLAMFGMNGDAGTRQEQLEFVVALGLPLLRHLWRGGRARRTALLAAYMWRACDGLLNDVLRERWQIDRGAAAANPTPPDAANFYAAPTSPPSPGWRWLRDGRLPWTFYLWSAACRARARALGALGLVFWDQGRLQRMGLYGTTLPRLCEATAPAAEQAVRRRGGKSVEELCGGAGLVRADLEPWRPATLGAAEEEALLQRVEY